MGRVVERRRREPFRKRTPLRAGRARWKKARAEAERAAARPLTALDASWRALGLACCKASQPGPTAEPRSAAAPTTTSRANAEVSVGRCWAHVASQVDEVKSAYRVARSSCTPIAAATPRSFAPCTQLRRSPQAASEKPSKTLEGPPFAADPLNWHESSSTPASIFATFATFRASWRCSDTRRLRLRPTPLDSRALRQIARARTERGFFGRFYRRSAGRASKSRSFFAVRRQSRGHGRDKRRPPT